MTLLHSPVKLNNLKDQFEAIGIGIVGMTYDKPEIIQAFHEKWKIEYPVLRDVDRRHVEAWVSATRNMARALSPMGFLILAWCSYL